MFRLCAYFDREHGAEIEVVGDFESINALYDELKDRRDLYHLEMNSVIPGAPTRRLRRKNSPQSEWNKVSGPATDGA